MRVWMFVGIAWAGPCGEEEFFSSRTVERKLCEATTRCTMDWSCEQELDRCTVADDADIGRCADQYLGCLDEPVPASECEQGPPECDFDMESGRECVRDLDHARCEQGVFQFPSSCGQVFSNCVEIQVVSDRSSVEKDVID